MRILPARSVTNVPGVSVTSDATKPGTYHMNTPMRKRMAVRRQIFARAAPPGLCPNRFSENHADVPIAKRNDGNTRSVGVNPCHAAWCNGPQATLSLPGVFTMIMNAIVMPRKMSSARMRWSVPAGCAAGGAVAVMRDDSSWPGTGATGA